MNKFPSLRSNAVVCFAFQKYTRPWLQMQGFNVNQNKHARCLHTAWLSSSHSILNSQNLKYCYISYVPMIMSAVNCHRGLNFSISPVYQPPKTSLIFFFLIFEKNKTLPFSIRASWGLALSRGTSLNLLAMLTRAPLLTRSYNKTNSVRILILLCRYLKNIFQI